MGEFVIQKRQLAVNGAGIIRDTYAKLVSVPVLLSAGAGEEDADVSLGCRNGIVIGFLKNVPQSSNYF